jgi:DNA polymerase I
MKAKAYILDGSGYLYRAYHGMPPMVNRDGKPMQMVYGFCKMMLALLREQPDYFIIVRDTPNKTVRHDADVTYKANRVKMPDDFGEQIAVIHEVMRQI